jgi:hypothetical protein
MPTCSLSGTWSRGARRRTDPEILRIEQSAAVCSPLACWKTSWWLPSSSTTVEREARGNLAFRQLLTGVYYSSIDDDVVERINRATAQLTH